MNVWRRWNDFSGRSRRREYWMFFLFNVVVGMILSLLTSVSEIFGILYVVFAIVTLVLSLAVGIRRMHDTGHSGWFILVPIYNLILAYT
ncbi:MAG: DUF805 domain-containing protein [Lewinellaceae bacterium]|nr:DUF805 domain-containing protein [Lewinellaceae bacterium]